MHYLGVILYNHDGVHVMSIYDITKTLLEEFVNKVDVFGESETKMFNEFLSILDEDDSEESEQIRAYIQIVLEEYNLLMEDCFLEDTEYSLESLESSEI